MVMPQGYGSQLPMAAQATPVMAVAQTFPQAGMARAQPVAQATAAPTHVQPALPDARACYRQGQLKKKPVDGWGSDQYRTILLCGNRIEWRDGNAWKGSLQLTHYSRVDYSPYNKELSVRTSGRELVLYPLNRDSSSAADEMTAWMVAVNDVIRQIQDYHQYQASLAPRVQYVSAPSYTAYQHHGVHRHHHHHHHRGGGGDVALAVGGGLLAGAMLGAMLD